MSTPEPPPCPPGAKTATTAGRTFSMAAMRSVSICITFGSTASAPEVTPDRASVAKLKARAIRAEMRMETSTIDD